MADIATDGLIFMQPDYRFPKRSVYINGEDVSNYVLSFVVRRKVNEGVCSAELMLQNVHARFTNKWTGMEVIKVYHDYADGTHQIFEGRLDDEEPGASASSGLTIRVYGRDYAAEALEQPVTKYYTTATACSTIFTELINEFLAGRGFTTVNVGTTAITMQPEWEDVPLWDCLKEVAEKCGFLFYCGPESAGSANWKDWHFFEVGSRLCTDEMLALVGNITSISNRGSIRPIKNYHRVYGQTIESLPLFRTAEDTDSQNTYWTKWQQTQESNIRTADFCQTRADTLLSESLTRQRFGSFSSISLPMLDPGDDLFIAAPEVGIVGARTIREFVISQSGNGPFMTSASFDNINKRTLSRMLVDVTRNISKLRYRKNPFGLTNSYIYKFYEYDDDDKQLDNSDDLDSDSYDVEVLETNLVASLASGIGTAVMVPKSADSNISAFSVRVRTDYRNDGIGSCVVKVSVDNKLTYNQVNPESKYLTSALGVAGAKINVRIDFYPDDTNTVPRFKAIGIYW